MFGQMRVEFVFAIIIFAVLIFYIVYQINVSITAAATDARLQNLKAKALGIMTLLMESPGNPSDWETKTDPIDINRTGLMADRPYSLNDTKISKLNQSCYLLNKSGYSESAGLRLYIWNSTSVFDDTTELLACGALGAVPEPNPAITELKVVLTRYVWIKNILGTIRIEVW